MSSPRGGLCCSAPSPSSPTGRRHPATEHVPKHGDQQVDQQNVGGEHVDAHQGDGDPLGEPRQAVLVQLHAQRLRLVPGEGAV